MGATNVRNCVCKCVVDYLVVIVSVDDTLGNSRRHSECPEVHTEGSAA